MFRTQALLAMSLLFSTAAFAQTTPATTRSTNTVGLGGTVSGSPTGSSTATPTRYDDPNSGMPSQAKVKTKDAKSKQDKDKSHKMKSTM
jgi:hypothetical protein